MSSIVKLGIKGIRSFDQSDIKVISFETPLTLIVGTNGSGKTTIIECLKYAATGEMPANTKNAGWIQDPGMLGAREVNALVKMSFRDCAGELEVATRHLQAIAKKKASTQLKTLDGTLSLKRSNGETTTLSNKCAAMNTAIPSALGVSKAILEYVIFCHQEDSTWPISEPALLKKRFDEIFNALKYTKALDQIKSVRKEQIVQVKVDRATLSALKIDMERAARIEKASEALHEEIVALNERTQAIETKLEALLKEQDALFQSGQEFERVLANLGKFRHERAVMQDQLDNLTQNVQEFSETDEELREMLANYDAHARRAEDRIRDLQTQRKQAGEELERVRHTLDQAVREEGRLKAEAEAYDQHILKRETLIRTTARQHNVRGFELEIDEDQVLAFMQQFAQLLNGQTQKLERMQKEDAEAEETLSMEVQELMTRKTTIEQQRVAAKSQLREHEAKLVHIEGQLNRATHSEGNVESLQQELAQIERDFEKALKESENGDWDSQIRQTKRALQTAEDDKDAVNAELSRGSLQADVRAKLDIYQEDVKRKTQELNQLVALHQDKAATLTDKPWNITTLAEDIAAAASVTAIALKDNEVTNAGAQRALSTLDVQVATLRDKLKREKAQMQDLWYTLEDTCGMALIQQDYPDLDQAGWLKMAVEEVKASVKELEDWIVNRTATAKLFEQSMQHFKQEHECLMCGRGFDDASSSEGLVKRYKKYDETLPDQIKEGQLRLEQHKVTTDKFFEAYERWMQLHPDVQLAESKLRKARADLLQATEDADKATKLVADQVQKLKKLDELKVVATETARLQRELRDLGRKTETLQGELRIAGASTEGENLPNRLASLKDQIRTLKREEERLVVAKEQARTTLSRLELRRRDGQQQLAEANAQLREQAGLQTRAAESQEAKERSLKELGDLETALQAMEPDLKAKRLALAELKERVLERQSDLRRETARLTASQNTLQSVQDDLDAYLNKGGPNLLKGAVDKTHAVRAEIATIQTGLETVTERIGEAERERAAGASAQRNMDDNLRLRRVRKDVLHLDLQIQELESKNAERDRERYLTDSKRLKDRYARSQLERSSLGGEVRAKDDELNKMQRQLETEYKDAAEVYRRHFIKVTTMEKANEDLEKYGKALDSAIMRYHAMKMADINRTIQDLWQTTYVGTDVDRIYIESEGEPSASNRTYKYNVRMVKGEADFEMRGRCSAGQKMLACIIIRLALAECFGISCGVLTLDEPTTNLDSENIKSLAHSLHNLVEQRRRQANFQLIIITHDETFLKEMGVSSFTDFYWRVYRDSRQTSQIEKKRATAL